MSQKFGMLGSLLTSSRYLLLLDMPYSTISKKEPRVPTLGPASLDSSVLNMPLAIMSETESAMTFFLEEVGIADVRGKVSDTTV